jgi:hypothetical protein
MLLERNMVEQLHVADGAVKSVLHGIQNSFVGYLRGCCCREQP